MALRGIPHVSRVRDAEIAHSCPRPEYVFQLFIIIKNRALRREEFGQGTAKRIVALVNRHFACQEMANARSEERPPKLSSELDAEGGKPLQGARSSSGEPTMTSIKTPIKAIRAKCLDCTASQPGGSGCVKSSPARFGRTGWARGRTNRRTRKNHELAPWFSAKMGIPAKCPTRN
jgi:hypothetical protein